MRVSHGSTVDPSGDPVQRTRVLLNRQPKGKIVAKKEVKFEHYVYLLLDSETGYSAAFSSAEGAADAAGTLSSHLNRRLSVVKIRYYYDKMWDLEAMVGVLGELKPEL